MVLELWTAMPHEYKDPSQPQDRAAHMHIPRGHKQADPWALTGQLVHLTDENQSVKDPSQKTKAGNTRAVMPKLTSCPWACTYMHTERTQI